MAKKKKQEINLNPKKKSPSISRFITESIVSFFKAEKYLLIASISGIFFFCLMIYAFVQLSLSLQQQKQITQQKEKVMHDLSFWEGVVKERPEYRDGYFMLAVLEYRIGKKEDAKKNVTKSLEIDPNFKEGREFERMLQ